MAQISAPLSPMSETVATIITKHVSIAIDNANWSWYCDVSFSCMDGGTILSLHGTDAVYEIGCCLSHLIHSITCIHVTYGKG
jgi:hypothetical protein